MEIKAGDKIKLFGKPKFPEGFEVDVVLSSEGGIMVQYPNGDLEFCETDGAFGYIDPTSGDSFRVERFWMIPAIAKAQIDLRNALESLPRVARPKVGETYVGVPPIGEYGWVHGRLGQWVGAKTMRCPETGETFLALWAVRKG